MKREPRREDEAHRAWSVRWWRECRGCSKEFKREPSWKGWWRVDQHPIVWHRGFVCFDCAPDAGAASRFFGRWRPPPPDFAKMKPTPPPPRPRTGPVARLLVLPLDADGVG